MKRILSIALGILLFVSCTSTGIEKTAHGIIVRLQPQNSREARNIRLQVVNEMIIHVSATSEKNFSTENSLITQPGLTFSDKFTVDEKEDRVILSTDSLDVVILLETGEIAFLNKKGNPSCRNKRWRENAGHRSGRDQGYNSPVVRVAR